MRGQLLGLALLVLVQLLAPAACTPEHGHRGLLADIWPWSRAHEAQQQHRHLLASQALKQVDNLPPKASAILDCFKDDDCLSTPTVWNTFLENRPSCFKPQRIWWSRRTSPFAVTLVTQLSADRLPQIRAQCATWAGPLAAALYLPLVNVTGGVMSNAHKRRLQNAEAAVDDLFNQAEHPQNKRLACQLRLMLVYEVVTDDQVAVLYPVNSLRNYARLMADTELIANIDVDMLPSVSVSQALQDAKLYQHYLKGALKRQVYVMPAFETRCGGPSYADNVATLHPKTKLLEHMEPNQDCVGQMRGKVAYACHGPTDFGRWFNTEDPYPIQYNTSFEPWFLSHRLNTKWFDAKYRGYGKNKIVQAAYSNASGVGFNVFTHGFLIHRFHTDSKARKAFLRQKFSRLGFLKLKGTVYEHIELLWNGTTAALASGRYKPLVEGALLRCLTKLEWWKGAEGP